MSLLTRCIKAIFIAVYAAFIVVFTGIILFILSGWVGRLSHPAWGAVSATVKVAVVDTGLDLNDPRFIGRICQGSKDFTGKGIADTLGHGTHVAGLISQYAGGADYCLLILKYYDEDASGNVNLLRTLEAFRYAVSQGVDYVNYSAGGAEFTESEYLAIRSAPATVFVVAAGNEKQNLDDPNETYYPASYRLPNIISVGCLEPDGQRCASSNYGHSVSAWELGDVKSYLPGGREGVMIGTSMATAVHTGKLVSARRRRYPQ